MMLAACGSGGSSTAPAASPATPTGPTAPATSPAGGSPGTLPAPPSGAKELANRPSGSVTYARYSISGMTPAQVISTYKTEAQSAGYSVTDTGGGGGGWGGYGGANAGLKASKSGSYLDVQAGGQSSGPTYFEVCLGVDEAAVDQCDQNSNSDSQSSGS